MNQPLAPEHTASRSSTLVSNETLRVAFLGTNFGDVDHRALLEHSMLKVLTKRETGYRIITIAKNLGLVNERSHVTPKGKDFIYLAFFSHQKGG